MVFMLHIPLRRETISKAILLHVSDRLCKLCPAEYQVPTAIPQGKSEQILEIVGEVVNDENLGGGEDEQTRSGWVDKMRSCPVREPLSTG